MRARDLRRAFDSSFAAAPGKDEGALSDLLAIGVAGDPYALDLGEVGGLFVDRVVTPLPALLPELLGLAGFRAALVPVYDLRALLGYVPADAPRWMVSTAGAKPIALVFDSFEGHLRVRPDALAPASDAQLHVRRIARVADGVRPVIDLASVLEAIRARAVSVTRPKER